MDKAALLAPRLPHDDIDIPGVGTVRVRGLTREELHLTGQRQTEGVAATERLVLHLGMVDPALTEDEVGEWQRNAPAMEVQPVLNRINELSGIGREFAKEAYKSLRAESGAGVRVLPGAEAGDDGGPAAAGDAG